MTDRPITPGTLAADARRLLAAQRDEWPTARDNFAALARVRTRELDVDGLRFRLQFNPARIVSTGAKVDPAAIAARPCFLCTVNLPREQRALDLEGGYRLLVNPFPILPAHFTVPHAEHVPQRLDASSAARLVRLSGELGDDFVVFYNGPRCGASAPDHLHFQVGNAGALPLEDEIEALTERCGVPINDTLTLVASPLRPFALTRSADPFAVTADLMRAVDAWRRTYPPTPEGDEPMVNVLAWHTGGRHIVAALPRTRHRPTFYFAEGDHRLMLSPASIDLAGLCVCPVERDFERITAADLRLMLSEVCPDAAMTARLATALRGVAYGEK